MIPGRFRPAARLRGLVPAALALLLAGAPSGAASFPAPRGTGGAVASGEADATRVGLEILGRGGNAADAAVAVALALAVVQPEAGNLGGGGFAVIRLDGELTTLDFRETAPASATAGLFLDADGTPLAEASLIGGLAAGVPGTPAGLAELHRRFGALPWKEVVEPAARLARQGFRVSGALHRGLSEERDLIARFPEAAGVWLPDGGPPTVGREIRLPELARTLRAYARRGPEAITRGRVAEAVARAARRHGGVLTAEDLAAYRPVWRPPVRFAAFGWEFASMDLPSSGGILLGQLLGILERTGWAERPPYGAERAHLFAETARRAFADRFLLGDPATSRADAGALLAPAWLDRRAAQIETGRAAPSEEVRPWPGAGAPAARPAAVESPQTTHLSVIDGRGGIVALTTTLNGLFGSGVWVPEAGFFLNNQMDDFTTAPGVPNVYGLIQGEANAVAPGKRMLSAMSPVIAWRGGAAVAAGGRGGPRIPTATAQVLLALLVDGAALQEAVDRPRVHHQWLPDRLLFESGALGPEARAELERRGHRLEAATSLAKVHAVRRLESGEVEAAADPRQPGTAGVVRGSG